MQAMQAPVVRLQDAQGSSHWVAFMNSQVLLLGRYPKAQKLQTFISLQYKQFATLHWMHADTLPPFTKTTLRL